MENEAWLYVTPEGRYLTRNQVGFMKNPVWLTTTNPAFAYATAHRQNLEFNPPPHEPKKMLLAVSPAVESKPYGVEVSEEFYYEAVLTVEQFKLLSRDINYHNLTFVFERGSVEADEIYCFEGERAVLSSYEQGVTEYIDDEYMHSYWGNEKMLGQLKSINFEISAESQKELDRVFNETGESNEHD